MPCIAHLTRDAYRPTARPVFPHVVLARYGRLRAPAYAFRVRSSRERVTGTARRANMRLGLRLIWEADDLKERPTDNRNEPVEPIFLRRTGSSWRCSSTT